MGEAAWLVKALAHGLAQGMAPDDRDARLAAALRENLRRRKAQGRAVGSETPDPVGDDQAEDRKLSSPRT